MADNSAVKVVIGGQDLTRWARVGRVRIDDVLNDAPNTAALTIVLAPRLGPPETGPFAAHAFDTGAFNTRFNQAPTFAPPPVTVGAPIAMYVSAGADQMFGGEITAREQYAEFDQPAHVRLDLTCIDYTRALNRRKVLKEYGQQNATAIVLDMIAVSAPWITTAHVQAGLPTITGGITFTFEEVGRALSRIAEKIGAYWYVDYIGDLHFFTGGETLPAPAPIVPGGRFADLKITADISQVRTRVIIEGDGGTAVITLPAGDAISPISQTTPFNTAGGMAIIGPTRVTYTGTQAGGTKTNTYAPVTGGTPEGPPPAPPTAPTPTLAAATTAGKLSGGPYSYAVTFELSNGARSDLGAPGGPVTITAAAVPALTSAVFFTPPVKGPIAVGVASLYSTSFVAANGDETSASETLGGGGTITGRPVADPTATMSAASMPGAGTMAPGYYDYAVTYLTPAGETLPTFFRNAFLSVAGGIRVGLPSSSDGRITGRRVYRSSVSAAVNVTVFPWHHVVDIPPSPPVSTYDDTLPDGSLPTASYPAFSTATDVGEGAIVTIPTSTDPRVTRRRLYRKDGPGQYRFIAEIPDNTSTVFNDVVVAAGGNLAPTVNKITTGAVNLTNIAIGPALTVRRRVFRTTAGGSQYRELVTLSNNTTTTYLDTEADSTLGGAPLPPQGTPATGGTVPPTLAGATTLQVVSLTGLPSSGWVVVESVLIRYTGTSSAGGFYLTGIPASGPGAITADIPAGTVVTSAPALVGVAPVVPLTLGDAVQLIVQVDDLPAQAALAALEGGDGVIEHYIQDRRLSEAGARARGLAELALFKTVETQLSYTTHDVNARSGRTVHVDMPPPTSLTGDFLIQRVTIDDVSIAANWFPRRQVQASTTRFSFEDVLNRILLEQT